MKQAWEKLKAVASSDAGLRIFSIAFAIGLWLFVNVGQKPAEWALKVPLQLRNLPADLMVTNSEVDQIEVGVSGPPALLSTLDPEKFKVVLDLDGARPGTSTFRLGADYFNPPRGVRIARISPSTIHLNLQAVAERLLPIVVKLHGDPPEGYKVSRVEVHPEKVKVRGPVQDIDRITVIETEPLELEGTPGQKPREIRLRSEGKPLSFIPERVRVVILLEESS